MPRTENNLKSVWGQLVVIKNFEEIIIKSNDAQHI